MLGREIYYCRKGESEYDLASAIKGWDFTADTKEKIEELAKKIHFVGNSSWHYNVVPFLEKYIWIIDELNAFADHFLKKPEVECISYSIDANPEGCVLEQRVTLFLKHSHWEKKCSRNEKGHYEFDDMEKVRDAALENYEAERFFRGGFTIDELDFIWVDVNEYYGDAKTDE
jgi:hypothetical protein